MATLRAVFELTDNVSDKLVGIAAKAKAIDTSFLEVEKRLVSVQDEFKATNSTVARDMTVMKDSVQVRTMEMKSELSGVKTELRTLTKSKWTVNLDLDTGAAQAKIMALRQELRSVRSSGMGGTSPARSAEQSAFGKAFGGGSGGSKNKNGNLSFNAGPITASGSKMVAMLTTLGPLAISVAGGALGVLTVALMGVSAAAIGAVSAMGAFALGIGTLAIPVIISVKHIITANKAIKSSGAALDKAQLSLSRTNKYQKDGTTISGSYTKATQRVADAQAKYNAALAKLDPNQRAAVKNLRDLKSAWTNQIQNGKSGERAMSMVNSGLVMAKQLLPFVAKQMDRFSFAGMQAFKQLTKETPRFKKELDKLFKPFPGYFKSITLSLADFGSGLVGLLTGAKPMTDYLVAGFGKLGDHFNKWANSAKGQNTMHKFFTDMVPVANELFGLIGDIAKAMFKIAMDPNTRKHTVDFIDMLRDLANKLPSFIEKMTDAASKLGPPTRRFFKTLEKLSEDIAPIANTLVNKIFGPLTDAFLSLPDPARHAFEGFMIFQGLAGVLPGASKVIDILGSKIGSFVAGAALKISRIDKLAEAFRNYGNATKTAAAGDAALSAAQDGSAFPVVGGKRKAVNEAEHGPLANLGAQIFTTAAMGARRKKGANVIDEVLSPKSYGALSKAQGVEGAGVATMSAGEKTRAFGSAFTGARGIGAASGAAGGASLLGAGALGGATEGTGAAAAVAGGASLAAIGTAAAIAAAVVATIAVAVASVWIAWKTNFGHVKEYMANVMGSVKAEFHDVGKTWNTVLGEMGIKGTNLGDKIHTIWEGIKLAGQVVGAILIRVFGATFDILGASIKAFSKIFLGVFRIGKGLIKTVVDLMNGDFSGAWEGIKKTAQGVGDVIGGVLGFIGDTFKALARMVGISVNSDTGASSGSSGAAYTDKNGKVQFGGFQDALANSNNPANFGTSGTNSKAKTGDGVGGLAKDAAKVAAGAVPGVGTVLHAVSGGAQVAMTLAGKKLTGMASKIGGGQIGKIGSGAVKKLWAGIKKKIGASSAPDVSGQSSSKGLLPAVAAAAKAYETMFPGLVMSSGFRPGAITEFGNKSLHSMGRAIDMAGPEQAMMGLWNYLLGNKNIQELIHDGMASYNGGAPVPYTGSDKHTDHVHVGFGDGVGQIKSPTNSPSTTATHKEHHVTLSFSGAHIEIKNGQDKEEFFADLAKSIKFHLDNLPNENADEVG